MAEETMPTQDRNSRKQESGSDPGLEDAMEAKEKELVEMNRNHDAGAADPDENADDLDDSDGFLSQGDDPEAQQS